MKWISIALASAVVLAAQEPAKAPTESVFQMSSEVGYRFLAGQHGSTNTYRSVVNLGEGPRILQFDSRFKPVSSKVLDQLHMSGSNWGDPFNSFQLNAEKSALYRVNFTYRNIAYFNALPSFASPQLAKLGPDAYATNQNSFDSRQRFWDVDLDLMPGRRWNPFFGASHNSGIGRGVSPFILDENSYPASSRIDYGYTVFRGGLRIELENLHLSLEQGGATFHDDTSLVNDTLNTGNRQNSYLGRQLTLGDATRVYDVSGNHIYSSANLTYAPISWLDLNGEFYYSRPRSDVNYNEATRGTILWLEGLRFVNGQQSAGTGYANQPRTTGGVTAELRPFSKLRIIESFLTDQTHNAGSVSLVTSLDGRPLPSVNLNDRLIWKQNEERIQVFFDLSNKMTLFGGYRYLWGESQVRRATIAPGGPLETGTLNRNSGLGGFVFRPTSKLTINGDAEVGRGDQTYFRTSLQNFELFRVRARYQLSQAWQFNARFTRLSNYNPTQGVNLDFRSQQANMGIQWTRKAISVMADYTRSSLYSDLGYLDPVTYRLERSFYRDNAHTGTLAADLRLPRKGVLTFGGSFFRSSGSRPSRYYQPLMRLRIPIATNLGFLAEWRNVSLGQTFYAYEAFGVQQFTLGMRFNR